MKNKYVRPITFILIVMICLTILVAGGWGWYALQGGDLPALFSSAPPTIAIANPANGTVISSGQALMIAALAQSDAGLALVELQVDGVVVQQHSIAAADAQVVEVDFPWFGSQTGWRQLSVIAYDKWGRASAVASIQVGVVALEAAAPEVASQPEAGGPPPAGDAPPPGPESPLGEDPAAPLLPAEDQPLPELPPQPQDAIPAITDFQVKVLNLVPNGAGVRIFTTATDDLGVERIALSWRRNPDGGNDSMQLCGALGECQLDQVAFFTPGQYFLSVQAFDTSGQASELKAQWVEVLGAPDQPPAVAEQDFDLDWGGPGMLDDIADRLGEIDLDAGFNADEFLDGLFGDGAAEDPPVEQSAQGHCAQITIDPRAEGNQVTLTVLCDLRVEEQGYFLYPQASRYLSNYHDGGIGLQFPDWHDNERIRLSTGDTFTVLDDDVTCGMSYRYSVRVDVASDSPQGVGISQNLAAANAEAFTPACAPGTIGAVNLRTEAHPAELGILEGIGILWDVASNGDWPANLPAEGVTFVLTRFDPASGDSLEIYRQNFTRDTLLGGGRFTFIDNDVQCGNEYWYSLAAIAADRNPDPALPGWLLRTQTHAPALPCPTDDLGAIEIRLTPHWINDSFVQMRVQMELPPGFNWPQGDRVQVAILRALQGSDCGGQACWQVMSVIPITPEIRLNGLVYDENDHRVEAGRKTYVYRLSLQTNFDEVQSGASFSATTPPAPPPPPEILRLTASNNCPGGVPRCVLIEWQLYEQPRENGYYAQAAQIAVERVVGAIDQQLFPVGMGDTRIFDLNPYVAEIRMANGDLRRVCLWTSNYRMVAFDAEGHTFGASPLIIEMPECNSPLNIVVEPQ